MSLKRKPRTRSFIRLRQRSTVLLPHPEGPMKAVMVPFFDFQSHVAHGLELAVVELLDVAIDQGIGRAAVRSFAPFACPFVVVGVSGMPVSFD